MEQYMRWVTEDLGISCLRSLEVVEIAASDIDLERGIICREDIPPRSELLRIPFLCLMCKHDFLKVESLQSAISLNTLREDDALAICLLYEKNVMGSSSKYFPHLKLLPNQYHSITNYTDEELRWFHGCNLFTIATIWKKQITDDFISLSSIRCMDGITTLGERLPWFTLESYNWALCTIWSRFVTISRRGETLRCMVPLFDFMNHLDDPNIAAGHYFDDDTDTLVLISGSGATIPNGEPITLNYGNKSNEELLKLYGFTVPNNKYDSLSLYAAINPSMPNFSFKKQLLKDLGIVSGGEKPFYVSPLNILTSDFFRFLRVQRCATMIELFALRSGRGNRLSAPSFGNKLEMECAVAAEDALKYLLSQYPHNIKEDLETIKSVAPSSDIKKSPVDNAAILNGECSADQKNIQISLSVAENNNIILPSNRKINAVILRHSEMSLLVQSIDILNHYKTSL